MPEIDSIIVSYKRHNEEEKKALRYAKDHNDLPYVNDLAQVMDGATLVKEGMLLIRKHPRFCYVTKHSHNYLEINFMLSGETTQILDGNKMVLKEGELLFISKNSKHEFYPSKEEDILLNFIILPEFFDFIFPFIDRNGNIKKFLFNLLSNGEESNSVLFHVGQDKTIQNIMENILVAYHENTEGTPNLLRHYFLILIYELLKRTEVAEETKSSHYDSILLFKVYNYIENNYPNGSLLELSKILNEDYNYLSKKIKKLTGFSFLQLLEKEKIKAAKSLLEHTSSNIEDIAYHIGYNNLTFFYKVFKKHEGMTPRAYKQSLKV